MIKVFLSSPYTLGDTAVNVKRQLDIADELMNAGFSPYVPLLSHFQHMAHPRSYEDWTQNDIVWLKLCDCVLRLDGESLGSDFECHVATTWNIPVFHSISELEKFRNSLDKIRDKG